MLGGVWAAWGGVWTGWLLLQPVAAVVAVLLARRRARGVPAGWAWRATLAEVGMVTATAPWIWMILTPRGTGHALSLVPFRELAAQATGDAGTAVAQIGGNLLVFAALGALLPVRWPVGPAAVAAVAATGSLAVETVQYLAAIGRVSSVDDLLLNVAGAVLAALATRRWWRRRAARHGTGLTTTGRCPRL